MNVVYKEFCLELSGGPPPRIPSFKRADVDRIYSEYIQVTLKAAEEEAAKMSKIDQPTVNPEKLKRKYKKRQKENQSSQGSGVSLLKPLSQHPTGTDVSEKPQIKSTLADANLGSMEGYSESVSEAEERIVIDDHQYTTQPSMESSAAINKQLSSEHSYISNPVKSPVMHGISLLHPTPSSEPAYSPSKGQKQTPEKPKNDKKVNDLEVVEEAVANIPGMDFVVESQPDPTKDIIGTSNEVSRVDANLFTGLNEPIAIDIKKPSVNYVCYFSLIRDQYRSSPNHKMSIQGLEDAVQVWQETETEASRTSNGSSCMWLSRTDSWVNELSSAIAFLLGAFPNEFVPDNFSPFVKCDAENEIYEWIGTGRDSDVNLMALTQWWWERKDLAGRFILPGTKEHREEMLKNQEAESAPQPPRAGHTQEEALAESLIRDKERDEHEEMVIHGSFHSQEKRRMENPGQPFTYHYPGVKEAKDGPISVGPVRTNLNINQRNNKVKPHPLLKNDRPPWVTMIVLVQDALARLPNGEGSKADICKYVTHSQYCNLEGVVDNPAALTTVVSGALDRLQGETDPCCKYYTDRKIWKYLHKGRSEEEIMRKLEFKSGNLSMKNSTPPKTKGPNSNAKAKATTETSASLLNTSENMNAVNSILIENDNAVNSILPSTSELPFISIEQPLLQPSIDPGISRGSSSIVLSSPTIASHSMTILSPSHSDKKRGEIQLRSPPLSASTARPAILSTVSGEGTNTQASANSVQMLKIMTPQGLKTVSLSSNPKSGLGSSTSSGQQPQASVLKRNIGPSFSIASSTSPGSSHAMANTKTTGGQIQIQIQPPSQHSGSNVQTSKSGMVRQVKNTSSQPSSITSSMTSKVVPRQKQPSTLQISSKF